MTGQARPRSIWVPTQGAKRPDTTSPMVMPVLSVVGDQPSSSRIGTTKTAML